MNGSALQEIPIATLRTFKISLPPTKAEQEAIAEALSDVDQLLGSLGKLIAKKRAIKQTTMQQLLTGKNSLAGLQPHRNWWLGEQKRRSIWLQANRGGSASTGLEC